MRIDKWLFAVRVFPSRSQATEACSLGRVRIGGTEAKPSSKVAVGDAVEVRKRDRTVTYEVVELIDKRVAPAIAATCFIDRSPRREDADALAPSRERGSGRPTKRDRRQLERLTKMSEADRCSRRE
ncbi:MAG: S4 domain-containing protein [Actinomycetota bacterium]|nr:S4 domain-containing protein [Actinomycetota bacterium]